MVIASKDNFDLLLCLAWARTSVDSIELRVCPRVFLRSSSIKMNTGGSRFQRSTHSVVGQQLREVPGLRKEDQVYLRLYHVG